MRPTGSAETHLELKKVGPAGHSLGLRPGDKLVGLNGEPFTQGARTLARRFSPNEDKRVTMHFQRADVDLTVISVTAKLGRWMPCPIAGSPRIKSVDADKVENWEILRSPDGVYDLFRHRASHLVWMFPLLWLAQMRLWPHFAGFLALIALGWPAGIWAMVVLYFLGGAVIWRGYAPLLRADRAAYGMTSYAVIAAESEIAVHRAYRSMEPDDKFMFGKITLLDPDLEDKKPNEATA